MIPIQEHIPLAPLTTIRLGGEARYFFSCKSVEDIRMAIQFANEHNLPICVLGGGSNIIFSDAGFSGLVLHVALRGITFHEEGEVTIATAAAGEEWDVFVQQCIDRDLAGIECLSGIPGFVGATPIQNVGAYGQEVRETIVRVKAIERSTLDIVEFTNEECSFGYRQSRFKKEDKDRYVVLEVVYQLRKNGKPTIAYAQVQDYIDERFDFQEYQEGSEQLSVVRHAVLTLRRRKSMVVHQDDPNTRSCGSFFMNPIVSQEEFARLKKRWQDAGHQEEIVGFQSGRDMKISAAWLIEHAGWSKGQCRGGACISEHHSLALVNRGCTTAELLDFASEIQQRVFDRFGIHLEREPVFVS